MIPKIANWHSIDELSDIRTMQQELMQKSSDMFNDVLKKAIVAYLGRPVDIEKDGSRFQLCQLPTYAELKDDGILLGTITNNIGHNWRDFEQNKITFSWTFVPAHHQM